MELQATKIVKQTVLELNDSNIGYVNSPEDKVAGISSPSLKIYVLETETGERMAVVGDVEPTATGLNVKGVLVHDNGKVVIGGKVHVLKQEFTTHEAAIESLESGEEYYLQGDNNVYRKV